MNSAKVKIKAMVEAYIQDMPDEFALVKKAIEMQRAVLREGMGDHGGDMRPLFELPNYLTNLLTMLLDEDETLWFNSKTGSRWFAKEFPVFSLRY